MEHAAAAACRSYTYLPLQIVVGSRNGNCGGVMKKEERERERERERGRGKARKENAKSGNAEKGAPMRR